MDEEFEKYVDEAVADLPEEFRKKLDNVEIFVEDFPTPQQIHKLRLRKGTTVLLGLYEGVPHTQRGNYGIGMVLPDKITIFRYPIMMLSRTREQMVELIKNTVRHEIGHHFGLSDEEIHKAENKKRS